MKKIYLLLLLLMPIISVMAQENITSKLVCASCEEVLEKPILKSGGIASSKLTATATVASAGTIKALIIYADPYQNVDYLITDLMLTGKFESIDSKEIVYNPGIPLVDVENYDAIFVFLNYAYTAYDYFAPLRNTLQAYMDLGKGVVTGWPTNYDYWNLRLDEDYSVVGDAYNTSGYFTLNNFVMPSHEILQGVNVFSISTIIHYGAPVNPLATVVAKWDSGEPAVTIRENIGLNNARNADLNLFPYLGHMNDPNSIQLLANALEWVSKKSFPSDMEVFTADGECNAVVDYVVNAPEKGSVVQTSGLPSGSVFPLGVTTNCFILTDSLGIDTTRCFTVTVNDTEPPVINCPENIVVSRDSAECGAIVTFNTLAEEVLLDEVLPGSLSEWNVTNTGGNPAFSYTEIESPYDGSTAIKTSVNGNTYMQCPSQTIDKTFDISGNTSDTDLMAYLEFTSTMDQYNFPYLVVQLFDNNDIRVGYQVYYGNGVISGIYANYAAADPDHYTELSAASGDMILDLSRMGSDIQFNKIQITLANYACVGQNSIVFDHLRVINGIPDNGAENSGPVASDNCSGVLVETSIPSGSLFPIGETTVTLTATDAAGNSSSCSFIVTVVDSVAPVAECKQSGGTGKAAYLRNNEPDPWQNGNVIGMNKVFGDGKWDDLRFSSVSADILFSEDYNFIFIDGCDDGAWEMEAFIGQNRILMEEWVNKGGSLFLNAAPNIDNGMELGFGGYQLAYPSNTLTAITILPEHPIFNGPNQPVGIEWVGSGFGHAVIAPPGQNNSTLIINKDNNLKVLVEAKWGKGTVLMGGMTLPIFQEPGYGSGPHPEIENLHTNMLQYLADEVKTSLEFQLDENDNVTITPEDIDGGSTDNCGIATIELDRTQFTKADIGEQTVTLTVTDNAGNSSSCQSTIKILESADQKALCNPIDINLDENGEYQLDSLDMVEITGLSPDSLLSFDDMKIFAYPDTFTIGNIDWPVFVRITEYDQNYTKTRCWAMVTVHDLMPPTVVGKDIEVMLDSAGIAVITKEQVTDPATFDVSGIVSTSIDKDTFTCENIGENWVILSATDIYGNVGSDSVLVTVNSGLPALDAITDVNITVAVGVCETTIEYPIPVINEICGISATQTAGLGRDAMFPVGTTTETWVIIDHKGDTTEVSFDVIVTSPNAFPALDAIAEVTVDEDAPEISVPITGITYGNDCQVQTVTVVAETDNTELVDSIAVVYNDGDTTGIVLLTLVPDMSGTAKITVTVTDSEGASMFRHFNLVVNEVVDTIANKEGLLATAVWTKEIEMGINMYPNPTKDMVTIDINNYNAAQTEVAVFSITGSEVIRKKYPAGETIRFSMKEQVSGVYLVKMNIDGNNIVKKLVVDKK